jgi:hypothetical protein
MKTYLGIACGFCLTNAGWLYPSVEARGGNTGSLVMLVTLGTVAGVSAIVLEILDARKKL